MRIPPQKIRKTTTALEAQAALEEISHTIDSLTERLTARHMLDRQHPTRAGFVLTATGLAIVGAGLWLALTRRQAADASSSGGCPASATAPRQIYGRADIARAVGKGLVRGLRMLADTHQARQYEDGAK